MTVYLSEHICDSARKKLEAVATIVDNFDHPEEIDAIIVRTAPVTAELLEKATKPKVIGKHGVGYNMVRAAIKALQKEGVSKISLIAFKSSSIGNAFWQGIGWTEREDINSYEFILNEENITKFVK